MRSDGERRVQTGTPPSNNNGFLHSRSVFNHLDGMQPLGGVGPPDDPSAVSYASYEPESDFHGLEGPPHPAGFVDSSPEFYPQPSLLDNKYPSSLIDNKYPPTHYSKNVSRGK